ncbi:phosphoglycerate kinase [Candidatus Pacearchaeota archaeon]|nr:phosphoglycerate kinase [Candidatus Pacearchaeota archaeon]
MKFRTLDDFNFKGKHVLVRTDINSEVENGRVILNDRIIETAKTIKELQKKRAKIVLLAHQGRPGDKDFTSLKQHAKLLNKFFRVKFVQDIIGKKAIAEIKNLKDGQAILLENVRYLKDEMSPSIKNSLIKTLAPLFDIYINDAFSVSHRSQTSVVSFPQILPSGIGRTMEKELKSLEKIKLRNTLFILAGSKTEENLSLLKKIKNKKNVLACGIFGQLCTIAKGKNLGAQNKFLADKLKFVPELKSLVKNIRTPIDFAVKVNNKRKELSLNEFPSKYEIFDIGKKTILKYKKRIKKAKSIFMKGTVGYCEEKQFCLGTKKILEAIASSKSFSILGGGHTNSALKKLKINKDKFDYVSLSGGALVEYLAGKNLRGLEALKKRK